MKQVGNNGAEPVESPDWDCPYNEGYTHEAMHTTWVIMDTFESHVMNARACFQHSDAAAIAEKAHQAMFDLYQLLGQKWSEEEQA